MSTMVFFSCSFKKDDQDVVDLVRGVATGQGLECVNVDTGAAPTPPEEVKRLLQNAAGLIAVATRRDALSGGEYHMPSAVRDEISIAYGLGRPLLLFREEGVRFDGFLTNYGSHLTFDRKEIYKPDFIQKLVKAVSGFRETITAALPEIAEEFHIEESKFMTILQETDGGFTWLNVMSKRIRFDQRFTEPIKMRWWSGVEDVADDAPPMEWIVDVIGTTRQFTASTTVHKLTADAIELSVKLKPDPDTNDVVELSRTLKGPHLLPLYKTPTMQPTITVGGVAYDINEGVVPIERTKALRMIWQFPRSYGLGVSDIEAVAASHTQNVDYPVATERDRMKVRKESFGGQIIVDISVENPLLRHLYGIAWSPPERKG